MSYDAHLPYQIIMNICLHGNTATNHRERNCWAITTISCTSSILTAALMNKNMSTVCVSQSSDVNKVMRGLLVTKDVVLCEGIVRAPESVVAIQNMTRPIQ